MDVPSSALDSAPDVVVVDLNRRENCAYGNEPAVDDTDSGRLGRLANFEVEARG